MRLSIIIVSWNTCKLLAECLGSVEAELQRLERHRVETIVVDNASTDNSVAMLQADFPWVQLLRNDENVGFAAANNQAIPKCAGAYILLLNSDTILLPGALESLVSFMDEHPEAGACGARLLNGDGTLQTSCYPTPTLAREFWRMFHLDKLIPLGSYRMEAWDFHSPRAVDILQGSCLMLRREIPDTIGLLDEEYFMYSEEVDYCTRIQRAGWKLYWVPAAQVIHYGGGSANQVAAAMFLRFYQSKVLYARKHGGPLAARMYKMLLLTASLARLLGSPISLLGSADLRRRSLTLTTYYWRLLLALPRM